MSQMDASSLPETLKVALACEDGTCCCIPRKTTVILISIINLFGCVIDLMTSGSCLDVYCEMRERVDSFKKFLLALFQAANMLLLIGCLFENATLVDLYMKYTMAYVAMGFIIAIYDFLQRTKRDGIFSLVSFLPEVVFLFVISRCLPLVDLYRKHLYSVNSALV